MHVDKSKLPDVERVSLKAVFGMKPGKWLTVLYALCIILILFFAGILPDLLHPSKRVSFETGSLHCAVYVDGNYKGATPFTVKLASGKHSIDYKINDVLLDSTEIKVGKPVFFAWLFPRSMTIEQNVKLNEQAYKRLTEEFFNDICAYSAILEYDSVNHYPMLFTEYVESVSDSPYFDRKVFEKSVLFVTTEEMKKDAQNAFDIAGINLAVKIQDKQAEKPEEAYLPFDISELPVTEAQYQAFIDANPKWAKSNIENLKSEGLADDYYLADFIGSPKRPVKNISYYAAKAYCNWKGEKLPTEKQWMQACLSSDQNYQTTLVSGSDNTKVSGMLGGLWEITDTYYIPGDRDSDSQMQDFIDEWNIDCEIIVKGGSYINKPSEISVLTAGTVPGYMCSDFMGFRTIR